MLANVSIMRGRGPDHHHNKVASKMVPESTPEPEFVNRWGAQESIPSQPAATTTLFDERARRLHSIGWRNRFMGSLNVYKFGLRKSFFIDMYCIIQYYLSKQAYRSALGGSVATPTCLRGGKDFCTIFPSSWLAHFISVPTNGSGAPEPACR